MTKPSFPFNGVRATIATVPNAVINAPIKSGIKLLGVAFQGRDGIAT
jgi:hypothetical protein